MEPSETEIVETFAMKYLKQVMESRDFQNENFHYGSSQKFYTLPLLHPFYSSLNVLPDAFVEVNVKREFWVLIVVVVVFSVRLSENTC